MLGVFSETLPLPAKVDVVLAFINPAIVET
jgi:hypothetical protein